jgi:hypothetical protein
MLMNMSFMVSLTLLIESVVMVIILSLLLLILRFRVSL